MPQVGFCRSLHRYLQAVAAVGEIQRDRIDIVPQSLKWKCVPGISFPPALGC